VSAAQNEEGPEVALTDNVTAVKKSLSATGMTTPGSAYSVPGEEASPSAPGTVPPQALGASARRYDVPLHVMVERRGKVT
jgi:hypothetical protein